MIWGLGLLHYICYYHKSYQKASSNHNPKILRTALPSRCNLTDLTYITGFDIFYVLLLRQVGRSGGLKLIYIYIYIYIYNLHIYISEITNMK